MLQDDPQGLYDLACTMPMLSRFWRDSLWSIRSWSTCRRRLPPTIREGGHLFRESLSRFGLCPSSKMASAALPVDKQTRQPIIPAGALDSFRFEDTTPVIGREFLEVNIVNDILDAPDGKAEERLRDLAYTSELLLRLHAESVN
jgi:hypothetical protein